MRVWPSYQWVYDLVTCPHAALARLPQGLLNSLDNRRPVLCVTVSHVTREQSCQPRAFIGRQWLSLRSSRQWAQTAQLSPVRGWVTDRAPTTTVRALQRRYGHWETQNDTDGRRRQSGQFRTTWWFRTKWRFQTTWQFQTTRSPQDLAVNTTTELSE